MAEAKTMITNEVESWPGMGSAPHRFGGVEFLLGKTEIGHLHGSYLLDVPFSKPVRDVLVAEGRVQPHHVLPESGWISFYLRAPQDADYALWLLRLSYLRHVLLLRRKRHGAEAVAGVDVEAALHALNLSPSLQAAFEPLQRSPGK